VKKVRKEKTGPLAGIRILDFTRLYPGPLGTMLLADMGADVIKIEDIQSRDYMRTFPPFINSESAGYLAVNRSKRSLALNLNNKKGHEIFFKLVKNSDIVIEQFRPGVLDKMGLSYEKASEVNPKIIYVSVTGYGQESPYANHASHDLNYIGYAGILANIGTKGSAPVAPAMQIADVPGGAYMSVIACLSALWAREKTGKGQKVDVSMLDSALPLMTLQMAHFWATGQNPKRGETILSGGLACYGTYECSDGKFIALASLEPKFWNKFCEMIRRKDLIDKQFVMEIQENLKKELSSIFKTKERDEWVKLAEKEDICLTPILELNELEKNSYFQYRKMFIELEHPKFGKIKGINTPLKFSETQPKPEWTSPELGEDSAEILQEIGYSESEIEMLQREGVIIVGGYK
jgi:crotonobetainyl-CoA:carnitine CoA-transferase CaiB-like acyl-CoA transferase